MGPIYVLGNRLMGTGTLSQEDVCACSRAASIKGMYLDRVVRSSSTKILK